MRRSSKCELGVGFCFQHNSSLMRSLHIKDMLSEWLSSTCLNESVVIINLARQALPCGRVNEIDLINYVQCWSLTFPVSDDVCFGNANGEVIITNQRIGCQTSTGL